MKKLYKKDKNLRKNIENFSHKYFLLKSIIKNKYLFILIRYKALLILINIFFNFSIISISNRCIISYSKKRFNKFSYYSRTIFLKKIQNGEIYGITKSNW